MLTQESPPRQAVTTQSIPSWQKRRMHHIFAPDGRAVIVAMDHARGGVTQGLERAPEAVAQVVSGGVDAILTTYGMARAVAGVLGGTGLIMALDSEGPIADYGVEQAVRFGADAVELKVFPGNPQESKLADLRRLAARCAEWGMPLLAEPIPVSFQDVASHTVENVAKVARIGAEAGADFVKVHYVGPVDAYRYVTESCYAPLLILGGAAKEDPRDALQMAADAIEAGARGVVFGRNIFTHPRPDRMAAALGELIHGGASVSAAARSPSTPYEKALNPLPPTLGEGGEARRPSPNAGGRGRSSSPLSQPWGKGENLVAPLPTLGEGLG